MKPITIVAAIDSLARERDFTAAILADFLAKDLAAVTGRPVKVKITFPEDNPAMQVEVAGFVDYLYPSDGRRSAIARWGEIRDAIAPAIKQQHGRGK